MMLRSPMLTVVSALALAFPAAGRAQGVSAVLRTAERSSPDHFVISVELAGDGTHYRLEAVHGDQVVRSAARTAGGDLSIAPVLRRPAPEVLRDALARRPLPLAALVRKTEHLAPGGRILEAEYELVRDELRGEVEIVLGRDTLELTFDPFTSELRRIEPDDDDDALADDDDEEDIDEDD